MLRFLKHGILFIVFSTFYCIAFSQQSIATIKGLPPGSVVTTTGTISTGDELGQLHYMQDDEAGIALYGSSLAGTQPGDSIIVTGVLSIYQGELQISPVMSYQLISAGHSLSTLFADNISTISDPGYTGRLMALTCVGLETCESKFAEGPYIFYDQYGNTSKLMVNGESTLIGQSISQGAVVVSGIWTNTNDQFHLLASEIADASEGSCKLIPPAIVYYGGDNVYVHWNNIPLDTTFIEWGVNDYNTYNVEGLLTPSLVASFPDSKEGTIYKVRLQQVRNGSAVFYSPPVLFSAPSTGPPIQVYFNHTVDNSFSDGSSPSGTIPSAIQSNVISLIDQVDSTLDIAVYNAGSTLIIDAIKRAVQRGVVVRYLTDDETSNSVLEGITAFPIYYRNADGIMHNKFMIGDADSPTNAFVWTGSTNWTINQLTSDANHAYVIRDQALAINYRREFDEMWGSDLTHNNSRIGENKNDNTAHLFSYNGIDIESYFSPSDEPDCHILQAISTADHHIEIGLLLLTSDDLINEIISLYHQGVGVRVILEDESSSPYAVSRLRDEGIPLAIHDPSPIFHHKYAIIDEGYPDSDPQVVTGSHNWTFSADHINDENTLIVHDQSFTNIFRQEFEARWKELNPSATVEENVEAISVYPNPAKSGFQFVNSKNDACVLTLLDLNGRFLQQYQVAAHQNIQCAWNQNLPAGYYVIKALWPHHIGVTGISIQPN